MVAEVSMAFGRMGFHWWWDTRSNISMDNWKINYRRMVSMPIRDMERDGRIVFVVDVYGVEPKDLCLIPGGPRPMMRAVERMGLDPNRYQASIWDVPDGSSNGWRATIASSLVDKAMGRNQATPRNGTADQGAGEHPQEDH